MTLLSLDETRRLRGELGDQPRQPPVALGAEEAVLVAALGSREALVAAVETGLVAEDFYRPVHGHIFAALAATDGRGQAAAAVELDRAGLLDAVGGFDALVGLRTAAADARAGRYVRDHAARVRDMATLRRLIGVAGVIAEMGYSAPADVHAAIEEAQALIARVGDRCRTPTAGSEP